MKYLESSQSSQHIQRLILTVVDSVVRILVKHIQDGHHQIFSQVLVHLNREQAVLFVPHPIHLMRIVLTLVSIQTLLP